MRTATAAAVLLFASCWACANADELLGMLHNGSSTITFRQTGRALVIRKKSGPKTDEYQLRLCEVWQPSASGHAISIGGLTPFEHTATPAGASGSDDDAEIRSISFPYNASEDKTAAAIVRALKNRPSYCD